MSKVNIKVFTCGEDFIYGAQVRRHEDKPNRFHLVFRDGDEQRVIDMPATERIDLAMAILTADGAKVKVSITSRWLRTKDVECPKCGAGPGDKCIGYRNGKPAVLKTYHAQRRVAARQASR